MSITELIKDIMSKKLIKLNADSSALQVAKMMSEYKVSSVILTDGQDKIVGIITEIWSEKFVQKICYPVRLQSYQSCPNCYHS
ncbi:MAG: CBS domain-containing protein [Candidatus Nitrosopolaris sp.]